jgi:acyl-coenzyme A synthetase/AMP-(fatty) acid ligase
VEIDGFVKSVIEGTSVNYLIVAGTPKTRTGKINRIQLRKLYD